MPKWIKPVRVRAAIAELADWRGRAKSQGAMHLWPLLALIEKGANTQKRTRFLEEDDRDFWDRYARLPGDKRPRKDSKMKYTKGFYVDPLVLSRKASDYYHRSPATIRVRTFLNSWRAAEFDASGPTWRLAEDYAETFERKALQRDGIAHRVPVVDLAVWLFLRDEFPNDAGAESLQREFRSRFTFRNADYDRLFEFVDEDPDAIFASVKPAIEEYRNAIESALVGEKTGAPSAPSGPPIQDSDLPEDDLILLQVQRLLALGTSGIILRGCPGTSKTWYVKKIAQKLVADPRYIYQVQFHPSYGYEDFIEGYKPDDKSKSGFRVVDKVFLEACEAAAKIATSVVFIIDEINRGDPARVFGEALTYIERGYRNDKFRRTYGSGCAAIPPNLLILGTMNQHDKSITQLDLALIRRFDHIDLKPSAEFVQLFLQRAKEFSPDQIERVTEWFESLQEMLPFGIGHTYFVDVTTPEQLHMVWRYRMLPYCETVLELDPTVLVNVKRSFETMYRALVGQAGSGGSA